jgi:hypothetical protein
MVMMMIGDDAEPVDYSPSEDWIDEFKRQCTDELQLAMLRYTMRKLHGIGQYGVAVDEDAAAELVQNVLGDALIGKRIWEPETKSLRQHIEDVIHSRTYHMRRRAKRFRHERVDAFEPDSEMSTTRAELEASLQMDREAGDASAFAETQQMIDQIRELGSGDTLVRRFLDALGAGARTRDEIMHAAKMSRRTFRTARARVRRLAEQLDHRTVAPPRRA